MHNDYADPKLNSYNNVSPLPVCSGPPGLGSLSWSSTAASASTASSLATSGQLQVRLGPASHSHVGRYSCHQNQTESVYLFVNGNHIQCILYTANCSPALCIIMCLGTTWSAGGTWQHQFYTYLEWKEFVLPCRSVY